MSPLLWLVLTGFGSRLMDYVVAVVCMAVLCTGGEEEGHAEALRACLARRQLQLERREREAAEALAAAEDAQLGLAAAEEALEAQRSRVSACLQEAERGVAAASVAVVSISKESLEEL